MHEYEALLEQHRNVYPIENRDYDRIAHFYRQSRVHDLSGLGIGHGLFVLYAALPVLLTPDLLHKLCFNFKNFYYQDKPQSIHPVAVSDLLMSSLCRQVKSNTYEIPESIRFFLLSLFQKCVRDKAVKEWLRFPDETPDRRVAEFTRYYAAHTIASGSPYGLATMKALQLNAGMYLFPAKALEQMARDMAQTGHDASRQHRLAITIEQALVQHQNFQKADQMPINVEKTRSDASLQLLLTYSRTLKKFYLEGDTDEVRTGFETLLRESVVSETRSIPPVLLPVPQKIAEGIRIPVPGINPNVELALELIRQEQEQKTGYLELGKCGLRYDNPNLDSIWNELGKLTHLETLILSNRWINSDGKAETSKNAGPDNGLKQIPACILQLTRLKKLIISGDVPNSWGIRNIENLHTLINLQYLDLSRNRISQISGLKKLKKLEELYLSNNEISAITGIQRLPKLRTLFLTNQKITNVEGLAQMQALQRIDLSHNPFKNASPLLPFLTRNTSPLKWVLKLKSWETKNGEINLHGTGICGDHLELISKGTGAILKYYDELQKKSEREAVFARRFNPYIVGPPIKNSAQFFGREEVIRTIFYGIHKNSFLIEGERRIGKTSLLYALESQMLNSIKLIKDVFHPVYLSIQGIDQKDFWRMLGESLFSIINKSGLSLSNYYDFYDLQKDISSILHTLESDYKNGGIRIIFLLDDIDQFQNYDNQLLSQFRRLLQEESRLGFIMAGGKIERYFKELTTTWFNQLVTYKLEPLDRKAAQNLIIQPLEDRYDFDSEAVRLVLSESQLKPMAIQSICYHAVNNMLNRSINTVIECEDVQAALKIWKVDNADRFDAPDILKDAIKPRKFTASISGNISGKGPNPYRADQYLVKITDFYNRQEILNKLNRNASGLKYLLKGPRKIGKSSLLQYTQMQIIEQKTGIPIMVDMAIIRSFIDFTSLLKGSIYSVIRLLKLSEVSLENLKPVEIIQKLINLASLYKRQNYIILIDNLDQILSFSKSEFEHMNEVLSLSRKNLTFIMTCAPNFEKEYSNRLPQKSFLKSCEIIPLSTFPKTDAENYIRQTQSDWGEVEIDKVTLNAIIKHCGYHPYYIQKICHELYGDSTTWVDLDMSSDIRECVESDFRYLTQAQQNILLQFSWGKVLNSKKISGYTSDKSQDVLNELEFLGFLRKVDTGYELGNYFLWLWIEERTASPKLNVFISYSHKDEDFKEALDTHLTMLKRSDKIAAWNDRAILPGTEWDAEIKHQLEEAHIILLLVSANFIASQYIWKHELARAMERHEQREASIIPIFIKYCDWKGGPFDKLQGLPKDAKPVGRADNDMAWREVAQGVKAVAEAILSGTPIPLFPPLTTEPTTLHQPPKSSNVKPPKNQEKILQSCATRLRGHASFFANLSPYVEADELEMKRAAIESIMDEVLDHLDASRKGAFKSAISEAEIGIRALLRSIHREKDRSREFFKEGKEISSFLKTAASLL